MFCVKNVSASAYTGRMSVSYLALTLVVIWLLSPPISAYAEYAPSERIDSTMAQTMVAKDAIIMDMVVTEEVVDWPELPQHMVELIMNKLMTPEISDYVRCGAVCTSWRTVFIDHHHHPPPHPRRPVTLPPFLMVPTPSSSMPCSSNKYKKKKKKNKKKNKKKKRVKTNTKSLSFYNVIDKKVYNQFQITIPRNRYFRGSASQGWLVAVDQNYNNCEVRLFNPFLSPSAPPVVPAYSSSSHAIDAGEILLPSLEDIWKVINKTIDDHEDDEEDDCVHRSPSSYVYLRKAILSADPLSNPTDYIVMAILGLPGKLAYCKPGGSGCHDKVWTLVDFEYKKDWGFEDVIYSNSGKFYALYYPGIVVVLDPKRNMMAVTLKVLPPNWPRLSWHDHTIYLVESAGCLFQVHREVEVGVEDIVTKRKPYSTTRFKVFMLEDNTQQQKEEERGYARKWWKLLINLGGRTFFLGDNYSMWVRASDYPGCKPNSIYFTDDNINMYHCTKWNGPHDLGVFNLVDGTIENHYPTDHITPIWPVPIWIKPIVIASIDLDVRKNNRVEVLEQASGTTLSILPKVSSRNEILFL